GGGLAVQAGRAATCELSVQACPGAGRCLQHAAAEPAPATPLRDHQDVGEPVPCDRGRPTAGFGTALHRGGPGQRGDRLLDQSQPDVAHLLCGGGSIASVGKRLGAAAWPYRKPRAPAQRTRVADRSWLGEVSLEGGRGPRGWGSFYPSPRPL